MSATRFVVSSIFWPDGSPCEGGTVRFQLMPGSYTGTEQYPPAIVEVTTDEYGDVAAELWTNEIGAQSCVYRCTLPRGVNAPTEYFDFTLPAGSTPIELSVLRLAGITPADPQYETLVTWILAQWRGAWIDGPYGLGDKVFHNGSSYIATADTVAGEEPGVHASWDITNQGTLPIPLAYVKDYGAAGGYVRSDGSKWVRVGGVAWADLTSVPLTFTPAAHTHAPADLTGAGADGGYLRSNGAAWVRAAGVAYADLSGVPGTFTPAAHVHAWADITSGLPATWAPAAHSHPASEVTAGTFAAGTYSLAGSTINGQPTWGSTQAMSISGVAATATKLATARAINGVDFDGSAAITVPVNNADDTTTNATMYPLWTPTAGGNYAAKVSTTKLSFNPSTGILTATGFAGPLNGTVGATTPAAGAFTTVTSGVTNKWFMTEASSLSWLTVGAAQAGGGLVAGSTTTYLRAGSSDAVTVLESTKTLLTVNIAATFASTVAVTGIASFAAGEVDAPSIARAGDLNTGFWFPAADTIAASVNGVEGWRLTTTGVTVAGTSALTGNVGIGAAPLATIGLYVASAGMTGITQFGAAIEPVFTSAATTRGEALSVSFGCAAASYTITDGMTLRLAAVKGAGSTVTNMYGLYINAITTGGTLNYAIKTLGGRVGFVGLPTAAAGLASGDLWSDSGVINIVA